MVVRRIDIPVVVVGAGPVGLMLAVELRLAGIAVVVVERLATAMSESRASQLTTRTAEILHERGFDDLLDEATVEPRGHFGGLTVDLSQVDSPFAGNRKVPQFRTEAALARRALDLGAEILRGHELRAITSSAEHVTCDVDGPWGALRLRAKFLVGCDGENSTVRSLGGFGYPATEATKELLRADVTGIEIRPRRFETSERGLAVAATREGVTRVMVHRHGTPVRRGDPPGFGEVCRSWAHVTGEDISGATPSWVDSFDNARGQAARYRDGRILLAGDAAHRHLPIGGQSLNTGLQDAVNLGWKLAAEVGGRAPAGLLDSYHDERHPVAARILEAVAAQELLLLGGPGIEPLREVLTELLTLGPARARLAELLTGVGIRYGTDGHPLVGRRMPAIDLYGESGWTSTPELLANGRGALLQLTAASREDTGALAARWRSRLPVVAASPAPGTSVLFGLDTVLLRPDGHVAWADGASTGLATALRRWFGEGASDERAESSDV